jgi:hypothetical protein
MTGASGLLLADSAGQQVLRAAPLLFPGPAGSHAAFQSFSTVPGVQHRPIIYPVACP